MEKLRGLITKATGSWYTVRLPEGDLLPCRLQGKLRLEHKDSGNPAVPGDKVEVLPDEKQETGSITAILPRKNYILRTAPHRRAHTQVIAANMDQALLVVTFKQPHTSTGFMDRFLLTAEAYDIPAVVVFNKTDLYNDRIRQKHKALAAIYEALDYPVLPVSAKSGENIDALRKCMKGKVSLIAGHSGVGKSTLLNRLDPELNLKTQDISRQTGKGRHTTSYAAMYRLPFGADIVDTPGIKEFGIPNMEAAEVTHYFREMVHLRAACKFRNCMHQNEPGCAIKVALEAGDIASSRYESYLKILQEVRKAQPY